MIIAKLMDCLLHIKHCPKGIKGITSQGPSGIDIIAAIAWMSKVGHKIWAPSSKWLRHELNSNSVIQESTL